MTPPPGWEEIQRQELSRLFGQMTRVRLVVTPVALLGFAALAVHDPTPWRRLVLALVVPAVVLFFVFEFRVYRRRGLRPFAVDQNLGIAGVAVLLLSGATGGLESPFLLVTIPLSMFLGLFTRPRISLALVLVQIAGVWALAAVALWRLVPSWTPVLFGGGPRAGHGDALLVTAAVLLSLVLLGVRSVGRVVRRTFDAMLRGAVAAQADALRAHGERAEELTALSAEIAHELKNPLASVKGLAALLEEGVAPGKPAERLQVLRREVDRMQGILDEFLNFSRPLVPLALGRVDLEPLVAEVAALHEGLARQRGVALALRTEATLARCDPRKVKQLLINLVQNAIEASPPGAAVEIETATRGTQAFIQILDRGRGLDPSLGERVFDPGVTTKPRGSGLGLTIARALARQHGGDLTLRTRSGGGAAAEISLPAAPARGEAA